jgi:hypothetical protein
MRECAAPTTGFRDNHRVPAAPPPPPHHHHHHHHHHHRRAAFAFQSKASQRVFQKRLLKLLFNARLRSQLPKANASKV